jgi:hypothetical protein
MDFLKAAVECEAHDLVSTVNLPLPVRLYLGRDGSCLRPIRPGGAERVVEGIATAGEDAQLRQPNARKDGEILPHAGQRLARCAGALDRLWPSAGPKGVQFLGEG